ncbi:hypothetical protein Pyrfu_0498 [Pyrolobus fumarii 1A]|uniref:Uncharacterized protein n=1 Tax=Pyrolobus fumarii (strain DSM 11204 / 1A) TaxID=694429 RepID=G0EGJ5_PYRF1|nr:hypothetical protein [Pyrolobus fumarii]AEM38369.1 hypothetical protein Pyrfu_0498 [Pyrolobus fumarii 1A]
MTRSSLERDYTLVPSGLAGRAVRALRENGFTVLGEGRARLG